MPRPRHRSVRTLRLLRPRRILVMLGALVVLGGSWSATAAMGEAAGEAPSGAVAREAGSPPALLATDRFAQAFGFVPWAQGRVADVAREPGLTPTDLDERLDNIDGGAGDDVVRAEAGDDHVELGEGDNTFACGEGDDVAVSGGGKDQLSGGPGSDTLDCGAGVDALAGDAGDDTLRGVTTTSSRVVPRTTAVPWPVTGLTAAPGQDLGADGGQVTVPAGATTATFDVMVHGDAVDESDETALVTVGRRPTRPRRS